MVTIRHATPTDAPALSVLEQLSPDAGPLGLRIEPTVDYFTLAARYPDARGFVALAPDSPSIIGMLFASTAPTQVNGQIVPGAYLYSLRVHPSYRRRGVGSALVAYACEQVTGNADAQVVWAAVAGGNEASLRTFRRAGFDQERPLRLRLAAPGLLPHRPTATTICRTAQQEDLPPLAAGLNAHYARHQFWRPLTAECLAAELAAFNHTPADLMLGTAPDGRLIGVVGASVLGRVARLRFLGLRGLPQVLSRLLSQLLSPVPIRFLSVRYAALPADQPKTVAELLHCLHRHHLAEAWVLAVILDPADPPWPAVSRLPGVSMGVHLLAKSQQALEADRPWYFG